MKALSLISLIATVTLSLNSFALSKQEVARKVDVLGKMAFGVTTHKVSAKTAREMVLKLRMKQNGEDRAEALESFVDDLKAKDVAFADMTTWGMMKLPVAIDVYSSDDSPERDEDQQAKRDHNIEVGTQILKELNKAGIKFGYTSNSSGYCGIGFMGLLIVDEENGIIYEIALTDSGTC